MSALTQARDTKKLGIGAVPELINMDVKASTKIYAGGIVCRDSTGYAVPGSTSTTQVAIGVARKTVDNSSGANGDKSIDAEPGVYKFNNSSAADAIARTEVGTTCYVVDDNTVAKTNGTSTRSAAGTVIKVDSDGVWVKIGL